MRRTSRPNVQSAKASGRMTYGELAEQIATKKRKDGTPRHMIKDLCDYCLHTAFIKRSQITMRRWGKKLACKECYSTRNEPKKDRAIPCYRNLIDMKK